MAIARWNLLLLFLMFLIAFWNGTILEEKNFAYEYSVIEEKLTSFLVSFFYSDPVWFFCLSHLFSLMISFYVKKKILCIKISKF